jgi:hypothetical protein
MPKIGHFPWRQFHGLLLPLILNRHASAVFELNGVKQLG